MAYTYSTWITAVTDAIEVAPTFQPFVDILPSAIDYAEQRMYRELDLLDTVVRDATAKLTIGTRNFTLPQSMGRFVVTNGLNVITPSTQTNPDQGTRVQLTPASRDFMDAVWSSATGAGVPSTYAPVTDQLFIVGPFPDSAYTIEVIGTIRPTPLSATNSQTYLTQYLPDVWFAATMIFFAGWQMNFGAQSDNPQMAMSWEAQYKTLIASVNLEEQRKRYASGAWGSLSPTPLATPSR